MRIPSAIFAAALLAACSPSAPEEGGLAPEPETAAPPAAPEPEEEPLAELPPADDPYVIVFLGDSLFAGYQLEPEQAVPAVVGRNLTHPQGVSVRIVNAGVNGGTAQGGLNRFDRAVPQEADAVLVEFGANDLFNGRDPADLEADLAALLERVRALGARPILVGMNAPARGPVRPPSGLFADAARASCATLYPFYFSAIIEEGGRNLDRARMLPDGLHPNAEGAQAIGEDIARWLERALARPEPVCDGA